MEFEQYVHGALRQLLRFAVVLTADYGMAEDIVQEVLGRAFVKWDRIGSLANPHAYVRRMIVNETASWHRKWGRIKPVPDTDLDRPVADAFGEHADVLQLVDRLPARQRAVIVLRYLDGLDDAQIAEVLGCRPVTVRGYAHRALAALRLDLVRAKESAPGGGR